MSYTNNITKFTVACSLQLTAGSMRNLILVAMILHLAITVDRDINGKEVCFTLFNSFILPMLLVMVSEL